jgi:hypothetical protein
MAFSSVALALVSFDPETGTGFVGGGREERLGTAVISEVDAVVRNTPKKAPTLLESRFQFEAIERAFAPKSLAKR